MNLSPAETEYLSNVEHYEEEVRSWRESGAWADAVEAGWDTYEGFLNDQRHLTRFRRPVVRMEFFSDYRLTYYAGLVGPVVLPPLPPIQAGSSEEW